MQLNRENYLLFGTDFPNVNIIIKNSSQSYLVDVLTWEVVMYFFSPRNKCIFQWDYLIIHKTYVENIKTSPEHPLWPEIY